MSSQFSALTAKLKEIFQINRPDLDFGVYRILNTRSDEIAEFLDKHLKNKVSHYLGEAKSGLDQSTLKDLEQELKSEYGKRAFNEQGQLIDQEALESPLGKKYQAIVQTQSNELIDESQVYSHLLTFFSRYYDEGDFISQRRYKGDTYAIPYAGEEVMLHWANKDQYYTKSGEMFSNYRFKLDNERSVLFRLVSADTARENRKDNDKDRRFVLVNAPKTVTRLDNEGEEYEEVFTPFSIENNELTILFEYASLPKGSKQESLNQDAYQQIITAKSISEEWLHALQQAAPTEKEPKRTLLQKHLNAYTQKNTADYFIHKDLGRFLRHELDFYIKNEVMHLDDVVSSDQFIQIERQLSVIKCLRQIGLEIISFLASLEDFQKKLWLKKKFVVSSDYCITLDRVDESLYAEIAANAVQWQQWDDLGFKKDDESWGEVTYLKQHQFMMVDTSLFDMVFKARLLKTIDDLDEQTDGIIIHSDNFQGLNILQEKYYKKIPFIYIDPPYNTDSAPIVYKNGYKDSSWISLLNDRIQMGINLGTNNLIQVTAIDHAELYNLGSLLNDYFGDENRIAIVTVQHNPKGRNQAKFFSENTEYLLFYTKDFNSSEFNQVAIDDEVLATFTEQDEISKYRWENYIRARSSWSRKNRPNNWFPIYVSPDLKIITDISQDGYIELWPKTDQGEFSWKNISDSFKNLNKDGYFKAIRLENGTIQLLHKYREQQVFKNLWLEKKYQSEFNGTNLLKNILGNNSFSFPKALYAVADCIKMAVKNNGIVLDYFAGSGTTAHAVMELNRLENSQRKYLLIEQGEYFDTVIKPRIQKVVYASDWKNGKPINPKSGISHCLKVVKLESYEDTLNNLNLVRKEAQYKLFAEQKASCKPEDEHAYHDYLMHYMLELESKESLLNIKDFQKPFNYQMNITTDSAGAYERKSIDLVETFNYLIGMFVETVDYQLEQGYVQVTGTLRSGEYTTILWRDCEKIGYAQLDQLLAKLRINPNDGEYQLIYVNGDHNIATKYISQNGEEKQLKVRSIEQAFLSRMFAE